MADLIKRPPCTDRTSHATPLFTNVNLIDRLLRCQTLTGEHGSTALRSLVVIITGRASGYNDCSLIVK